MGPCAKKQVKCTIVTPGGEHFVGENLCRNPQAVCPRLVGEGYEKCISVCNQPGHAETEAIKLAAHKAVGATAYLEGHTHACRNCQESLFAAGVQFLSIGKKPPVSELMYYA